MQQAGFGPLLPLALARSAHDRLFALPVLVLGVGAIAMSWVIVDWAFLNIF